MSEKDGTCLSCTNYRPKFIDKGICRVDRDLKPDYPVTLAEDGCAMWFSCGQQYYIRVGWIKGQKAK